MNSTLATIQASLLAFWQGLLFNLPRILVAIVVLLIGLLLARFLGAVITRIARTLQLDAMARRIGLDDAVTHIGVRDFSISRLLGWLVQWFLIVVVFITVADLLGWTQVTQFLTAVALYLPRVFAAILILLAGLILANFVAELVRTSVRTASLGSPNLLAAVARWAIIGFTVMAALIELGIASGLLQILFAGLVGMLALAGGIAFGLGGRDLAHDYLERLRRRLGT